MINEQFVTRDGSRLVLGGEPFRFAGPNIYWLGLDENVNGIDWPSPFRVTNALDTAIEMGATVVRSHTLGASHGCEKALSPTLGEYNEEAFRRVDFAIKEAGLRGLRLIIPFVCNWHYYHGGRKTFAQWRGLDDADAFYTDEQVIADFEAYITVLLNRINSYTGIAYKDDPTIMAWELGNELNNAPVEWVRRIVRHVKSLDRNHLVAHGKQFQLDADKLQIEELDILDVHYYPANAQELTEDAAAVAAAGKVYIAGEFGWPDCDLTAFLNAAEELEHVSGTLFWSLFGHHDRGGYVQHFDGFAVHYPGCGVNEDIFARVKALRTHAYRMSGRPLPSDSVPECPVILDADRGHIAFRGVVGAAYYTVERSLSGEEGSWQTIYDKRPADHSMPWIDPTRVQSTSAYYRVKAINVAGMEGDYSEVIHSAPF
ncbi:mannan endo-1,4-beta-mannosidase [Paenibacillus phyllosphaerae]|uniref:mannan endo-1,4-beta-mannosidase n=1 Tax=Paenibacillus phyllosphaerae TaxID=274593 RepID=A0A7W5B3L3_9BACL|nr:cellulase family glycosylhydrolase [Paenibacillus phyllosphaerae]MBB3113708.1 mannan endo-1,4-beta-mannosidase [Paenibacillus phyllosphaerae]